MAFLSFCDLVTSITIMITTTTTTDDTHPAMTTVFLVLFGMSSMEAGPEVGVYNDNPTCIVINGNSTQGP